jgi:predicted amidohydrolase YtcJ
MDLRRAASLATFSCIVALAIAPLACRAEHPGDGVDLILTNGRIVTLDRGHPEAQAVAIRGDRIAAVGDDATISRLAGPATRRIDLKGGAVFPGFVDAHGHVASLGERLASLDLRGIGSVAEVAARVRQRAGESLPAGAWITGGGWDQNLWPGEQFPDHRPLTEASPDRPVLLRRVDGHASWANRSALLAAGINRATPDPEGGRIVRDARGEPTGVLVDNAMLLAEKAQPKPDREQLKAWIRLALDRCASAGLTEVHDAGVPREQVDAYREMAEEGPLPLRVYLMWDGTTSDPIEPLVAQEPFVGYRGRLTLRAVKLMVDGAMGSRGAVFFEDYTDAPGTKGLFVTAPEEIERRTILALRRGYQVCTHAIGDRGIHEVLQAYERALAAVPVRDPRLRIEHLQAVAREDVPTLKRLGIIASMQPSHATSDMYWAEERIGVQRGRGLYAWRWVLDLGIPVAAGSDFPVDPEQPLVGLHSAVTRQDLKNWPEGGWHPDQKMTLEEAIAAYTAGAAYAAFEEHDKGRIAPGLWADLTILGEDLRAVPPERIPSVEVRATIVGGLPTREF